jgi:DNA repair protein RecN (Recombination protein N)
MLRLLSIRNFAVVEKLEIEFDKGFTVLTGETGAGKSILLDALSLLLGDRFEPRQLRPGADRAEIAAEFDIGGLAAVREWLAENELGDRGGLLLRRVLDAQGKSRAYVNGSPATLAQLEALGERLIDLHGQHAHQSLGRSESQRTLLDAYGGSAALVRDVGAAWRAWHEASALRERAVRDAAAMTREREALVRTVAELTALDVSSAEWNALSQTQSRLANAASLLEAAAIGEAELADGDAAIAPRLAAMAHRLEAASAHDKSLEATAALIDEARIRVDEAARSLRSYRERLDLDPAELARVESRLSAIHDVARRYRVRPEELPALLADTQAKLTMLSEQGDVDALIRSESNLQRAFAALASELSAKRKLAAAKLGQRVGAMMKKLAMAGGRVEISLQALDAPASYGMESVEILVATHPKQALAPLARVASGGELSRLGLAIQVALAEVADVPTLVFDEVDTGIGGAVAATVGRMLQQLGSRRQVLCVTHLPQVAACADHHDLVSKQEKAAGVSTKLLRLDTAARVDELARMLGGREITAKTRAHARELLEQQRAP